MSDEIKKSEKLEQPAESSTPSVEQELKNAAGQIASVEAPLSEEELKVAPTIRLRQFARSVSARRTSHLALFAISTRTSYPFRFGLLRSHSSESAFLTNTSLPS